MSPNQRSKVTLIFLSCFILLCFLSGCLNDNQKEEESNKNIDQSLKSSDFVSAGSFVPGWGAYDGSYGGQYADVAAPVAEGTKNADEVIKKEIEAADIIKIDDQAPYLYLLNQYRGLIICDITQPDNPSICGRLSITGRPEEMYIRNNRAYVIVTSDDAYNPGQGIKDTTLASPPIASTSSVTVVDITDKSQPAMLGSFDLDGAVTDSRLVDSFTNEGVHSILYVVSSERPAYWWGYTMPVQPANSTDIDDTGMEDDADTGNSTGNDGVAEDITAEDISTENAENTSDDYEASGPDIYLASLDVSNPADIQVIDRKDFGGTAHYIHVSEKAIFVESRPESYPASENTTITYIDISDPTGHMLKRGSLEIPGRVEDEFKMDYADGYFRICTYEWKDSGISNLYIIDTHDPDNMEQVGKVELGKGEQLFATRFDGNRAYMVTFERKDPLWVIDLHDPANPKIKGELVVPGWSTHIEPRGDRLIALGVDDSNGQKVSISLFNVSDPNNPGLIERLSFGDQDGWSTSVAYGDIHALTILADGEITADNPGLILLPYSTSDYSENYYHYDNRLQLIEYSANDLSARGWISQKGSVLRSRSFSERLFSISTDELQVIDASDRDNLKITASLPLASNVIDFIPLANGYGVELISEISGNYLLRAVPLASPDSDQKAGEIRLGYNNNTPMMISNGNLIYLIKNNSDFYNYNTVNTQVQVYDFTDPWKPGARGSIDIPGSYDQVKPLGQGLPIIYSYSGSSEILQLKDNVLVFNQSRQYSYYDYGPVYTSNDYSPVYTSGNQSEEADNKADGNIESESGNFKGFLILDLSDPNKPDTAAKIPVDIAGPRGLFARDDTLYFSYSLEIGEKDQNRPQAKYYLGRIDLSDLIHPVELEPINIPGFCVGLDNSGSMAYTINNEWTDSYSYLQDYSFNVVKLEEDKAYPLDKVELKSQFNSAIINNGYAYICGSGSGYGGIYFRYYNSSYELTIINLNEPENLIKYEHSLADYNNLIGAVKDKLFMNNYNFISCYSVVDPEHPQLEASQKQNNWYNRIALSNNKAYLPLGYYGVWVLDPIL